MGRFDNWGPIMVALNLRCRTIIYDQQGARNIEINPYVIIRLKTQTLGMCTLLAVFAGAALLAVFLRNAP